MNSSFTTSLLSQQDQHGIISRKKLDEITNVTITFHVPSGQESFTIKIFGDHGTTNEIYWKVADKISMSIDFFQLFHRGEELPIAMYNIRNHGIRDDLITVTYFKLINTYVT